MSDKFSGILLCTDLDDTLLTTGDKRLTQENKSAIEYFMSRGGYFTFSTGRIRAGIQKVLDMLTPNAPLICYNGATIHDLKTESVLYGEYLDKDAIKVAEFIEGIFPDAGIEICTENAIYFSRENRITEMHRRDENISGNTLNFRHVFSPWKKIIFPVEADRIGDIAKTLTRSKFYNKYTFVQSSENYYEVLPKGVSKGSALLKLADILGIEHKYTIGVGDNHNDIEIVKNAGVGIAVANAVPELRAIADIITVDNNSNALAAIISSLDMGLIKFD